MKTTKIRFAAKTLQGSIPAKNILTNFPWLNSFVPKPVRSFMPEWFKRMKPDRDRYNPDVVRNLKHCPSFVNMMNNGYVLRSQADIIVSRDENGQTTVSSNLEPIISQVSNDYQVGLDIDYHDNRQFGEFFPHEEGFLQASIKFNSPFIPEDKVDVVFLPCWWHESYKYVRAFHGMFSQDSSTPTGWEVNTALREPEVGQSYCIPAGTPLAQIVCCNIVHADFEYIESEKEYKKYFQHTIANRLFQMVSTYSKPPISRIKSFLIRRDK